MLRRLLAYEDQNFECEYVNADNRRESFVRARALRDCDGDLVWTATCSTPIRGKLQCTLTASRQPYDPMLFTSPFFENTRLSSIAFTERRSSAHQPITIQPTEASLRLKNPQDYRHLTYRERIRMQRNQRFNQGRRIDDEEEEEEEGGPQLPLTAPDFHSTDQTLYVTAITELSSCEHLIAQKPSEIPSNIDHKDNTICRYPNESAPIIETPPSVASIAEPHLRSTSNSPTPITTLSISAPSSVRLGLIPRRLDRSLTPSMHGSSVNSLNSLDLSNTSADNRPMPITQRPNAVMAIEDRQRQLLVTTVSLLAFGYAFIQSMFDL